MNFPAGSPDGTNEISPIHVVSPAKVSVPGSESLSPYSLPINESYSKELQMNEEQRQEWREFIAQKQSQLHQLAQTYQALFPEFQWGNAAMVTWSEITEHNGSIEPGKDAEMYAGELNQWVYWSNQCDARKIKLEMFFKILNNTMGVADFKKILSQIHTELILGDNGQRVYWPQWMQGGGDHPRRIAGDLRRGDQDADILLNSLKKYLQENGAENQSKFTHLATFFRNFMHPYYAFSYGNTSMSIGIINAALKMRHYNPINHADVGQYDSVEEISQIIERQNYPHI